VETNALPILFQELKVFYRSFSYLHLIEEFVACSLPPLPVPNVAVLFILSKILDLVYGIPLIRWTLDEHKEDFAFTSGRMLVRTPSISANVFKDPI
ncbi:hypothetical protein LTR28_007209, partial [Elasticomyces elasticus]